MRIRGDHGRFIANGGLLSEKRDKPCPDCGNFIMRKSTRCRSCANSKENHPNWRGGFSVCPVCNNVKSSHAKGICWTCFRGERHFAWKGDKATYYSKHSWLSKYYGSPKYCCLCLTRDISKTYEWASKTGNYDRDIKNFFRLCKSCHIRYDHIRKVNNIGNFIVL